MAVRYKREYSLIIGEMVNALKQLDGYFEFLGIGSREWHNLGEEVQGECLKTMSHDIIYGLGTEPVIYVGQGSIKYEPGLAQIRVFDGDKAVYVVRLN
ncbi:MAG TPA: hypothetical protein VFD89_08170 [Clostridia bacterium]|nr:hypothetical protein [Clostridia bacterium]